MKNLINNDDLDKLEERLTIANESLGEKTPAQEVKNKKKGGAVSLAIRIGIELISAIIVGTMIGIFIDQWLETSPWFLIFFVFLGFGAGILNIYKAAIRL